MKRLVAVLALAEMAGCAAPATARADETILETGGYWRVHATCRDGVVPLEVLRQIDPTAAEPRLLAMQRVRGGFGRIETEPPPAGWVEPDFDDSAWFRAPGPISGRSRAWGDYRGIRALLCARGKFTVNDPDRVRALTLTVGYRGGVVVYLNGREVARQDLPDGEATPFVPGAPYPREAYVDAEGNLIGSKTARAAREEAEARRDRRLGPVSLPPRLLRKGLNVLAVEIHRSDFRPETLHEQWDRGYGTSWSHIELNGLRLSAEAGRGAILPNTSRPEGFRVWNQDVHRVFSVAEYGDPNEPLRPVRMVGVRNGVYSGQVLVGSDSAIVGLQAAAGDLSQVGGPGRIPASQVEVRYGVLAELGAPAVEAGVTDYLPTRTPAFLALERHPPERVQVDSGGAVQPVWVTVRVPRDVPAGEYQGALTISAGGLQRTRVPIALEVIDWTLPDPRDFRSFVGIYQSPETLALRYKVPMWSEEHWALMEKSFHILGQLGNRLLIVPLVNRTQFGNDECLVPWLRRKDGTYDYDFTVHDRLLDLFVKYCQPAVISYQVWTAYGGGYHTEVDNPKKAISVTVVDAGTGSAGSSSSSGRRQAMALPAFGTEQAGRMWKPLLDAVRERLRRRGLEKSIVLGIHSDNFTALCYPVVDLFREIVPEVEWHCGAHNRRRALPGRKGRYVYTEYLYVPNYLPDPRQERRYGWTNTPPVVMSQRIYDPWQPPMMMRTMVERALVLGDNGAGRMGLDYWPVLGQRRGLEDTLINRWPESSSAQRRPCVAWLALPGRDGAVFTIKTEALREGLQEAEARVFVEEALLTKKITGQLAEKCQQLLDRRTDYCRIVHSSAGYGLSAPLRVTHGEGWQKRSEDLYRAAAEIARKIGK